MANMLNPNYAARPAPRRKLQTFVKLHHHNAAITREEINGVKHFVFNYRERADAAQEAIRAGMSLPTMNHGTAGVLNEFIEANRAIPAAIQNEAERYSDRISSVLRLFNPVMRRHQGHGALDSSKLARLARPGLSAREFEFEAGRAYKRRVSEAPAVKQIRIAIVGDFNYSARSANPQYAPTLAKLIHVISQACVIAGVPCAAYGTRGTLNLEGQRRDPETGRDVGDKFNVASKEHSATAVLKDYHDEMNGPTFALLQDESAFVMAYASAEMSHSSENGNGGIEFAKSKGADFIVAVGNFPRAEERALADVHVGAGATVGNLVDLVVAKLEKRLQENAA